MLMLNFLEPSFCPSFVIVVYFRNITYSLFQIRELPFLPFTDFDATFIFLVRFSSGNERVVLLPY